MTSNRLNCRKISQLLCPIWLWQLLIIAGCNNSQRKIPAVETPAFQSARTQIERGPVKVTVELSPNPVRLSDEPTLTVTIDYETGVEIHKPPFGEAVGGFLVRDFQEPLPEFHGGRETIRQIYTLEPIVTGVAHIDPIMIHFTDKRPNGDGKQHQLETEALAVNVLSVLRDTPSLAMLKGMEGPRPLQEPQLVWMWIIGGGMVLAAAGLIWYRRRQRRGPAMVLPTPREQAALELESLRRSGTDRDDVKRFYVELTDIVRRYIERTTGIQAPDQTTEEFLREIGHGQVFQSDERRHLKDFLEAADLVKFAAHRPNPSDIDESYRRAGIFVGLHEDQTA